MTDGKRVRLAVPDEPVPAPPDFARILLAEAVLAERLLEMAPKNLSHVQLAEWPAHIDSQIRRAYGSHEGVFNAVTGVYYAIVSNTRWSSRAHNIVKSYIGSTGQSRLIQAMTELPFNDRRLLVKHPNFAVKQATKGAWAVTRLAAALTAKGATCALPTTHEDVHLKIDLLCAYNNEWGGHSSKKWPRPCSADHQLNGRRRGTVHPGREGIQSSLQPCLETNLGER